MNVLVTGGAGFLGQQLIRVLLDQPKVLKLAEIRHIICFDQVPGTLEHARVRNVAGDMADAETIASLLDADTGVVIHLAAVVSGTAEADFDLGMRVNLDGTRALLQACRGLGTQPRVLFSSSLAVFGGQLPEIVDDSVTPTPQGSYGAQKLMGELLVQDYTRKGFIDGRSVRIPTVVVRPGRPNGAASGFASSIVREPLAGREAVLPVSLDACMWISSPRVVIANLLHALALSPADWGWHRSVNLPGLTASMADELAALEAVGGSAARALVKSVPDEGVRRLVQSWPARFNTARATAMGFQADSDFLAIVRAYVEDHPQAVLVQG